LFDRQKRLGKKTAFCGLIHDFQTAGFKGGKVILFLGHNEFLTGRRKLVSIGSF
jgi:hypothetical protein